MSDEARVGGKPDMRFDTITFMSDYGYDDEFVGVCKSVIRSIAPEVAVIDLTHGIRAHDVRAASLLLARSAQWLNPGVVLAVVDPGVGTRRRAIAVEVGGGTSVLVGPDNGLLAPAVQMVGGATKVVELVNERYRLQRPGVTFDGRDVFAPAAAYICRGVPLEEFGPTVDPNSLTPALVPVARDLPDGGRACEVLWIDRFGNAQLNVAPEDVADLGVPVRIEVGSEFSRSVRVVGAFDDLADGEVGLVVDSYGLLAVALRRRSAAEEIGLREGSEVVLRPIGVQTPVDVKIRTGDAEEGGR
ncbi:MAG: hypothetical protein KatS3mg008_1602 [Acidimicrobiales bacterium]|nr:MAG: hypothetical protein KatS3mg008_1602 [Acidimicrobiales bacterium]